MSLYGTAMAVTVASTTQYVFKRNFNENRWASVGTQVCKVQVVQRGSEFSFRINDGNGVSVGASNMLSKLGLRQRHWVCFQPPLIG